MSRAALRLEVIGDNLDAQDRLWRAILPRDMADALEVRIPKPWVAEIKGPSNRYKYTREFLTGHRDYSEANSIGSRGVYMWFTLCEGPMYEVYQRITWRSSRRYFCKVEDGRIVEVEKDEVDAWLRAR